METKSKITNLLLASSMLAFCGTAIAQINQRALVFPKIEPQTQNREIQPSHEPRNPKNLILDERQGIIGDKMAPGRSDDDKSEIMRQKADRAEHRKNAAPLSTIPYWSGSLTYHGLEYNYDMVGTDPKRGSATTTVPTVLIPLRFVFPDGNVFDATTDLIDGQTPIQGMVNSPVFQNHNYVIGGTSIGNTQYGDAFQRANFWDSVSDESGNYHVLLAAPDGMPVQTIIVPAGKFGYLTDPGTGQVFPSVDGDYLYNQVRTLFRSLNINPQSLTIFATGKVLSSSYLGYHDVDYDGTNMRTYILTTYQSQNAEYFGSHFPDTTTLSHEIADWMDAPFANNNAPGWELAGETSARCDSSTILGGDYLEVADPPEFSNQANTPIQMGSRIYYVQDAVFLDFFSRGRSRSVNGQYSLFGSISQASPPCTGYVDFNANFVDFPGATFTSVIGINNRGSAVGYYTSNGRQHGFVLTGSGFTTLDYPGDLRTIPQKINETGATVGYFYDRSGIPHGFLYTGGAWSRIDFPGSSDTVATGINSAGDIVGAYDISQPITHGFLLSQGQFQRIDTPYGTQSSAEGINDPGVITGYGWTDAVGPYMGFRLKNNIFTEFSFPAAASTSPLAINNFNDLVGLFVDPNGTKSEMLTIYGYPYLVYFNPAYSAINGNNDLGQICGFAYDYTARRYKGFIGDMPLATPTFATVVGRVLTSDGRGLRNATVSITDSQGVSRTATTSSFGSFSFDNVSIGGTYTFRVSSRLYRLSPQTMQVNGNLTLPDFVGLE